MDGRRLVLAAGLLTAVGCQSPPTQPTQVLVAQPLPAPPAAPWLNLTGTWRGWYRISSCTTTGTSGCGGSATGIPVPFELSVTADPSGSTGTFQGETPGRAAFVAPVTGTPQADGSILFTGVAPSNTSVCPCHPVVEVPSLRVQFDPVAGVVGTVSYLIKSLPALQVAGTFTSAARAAPAPAAGSPAAVDPVGTWVGTIQKDSCAGPLCAPKQSGSVTLAVVRQNGGLVALLSSDLAGTLVAELAGTEEPAGTIHFAGGSPPGPTPETDIRRSVVPRLDVRIDAQSVLTGTIEYTYYAQAWSASTIRAHIISATRRAATFSPGQFEGSWRGAYIVRQCTGDCEFGGQVGRDLTVSLELSQAASSLIGWWVPQSFPLTGTVSGPVASVSGERVVTNCPAADWEGVTCTQRVIDLSASVDVFGRLVGTIKYLNEGSKSKRYSYTTTGELWNVIQLR